ncbi:single-stranded-DNA-specific exonuclease RecJ [Marinicrinis sediminis]|uniref:Single-stranded-DNA-specific exonuclease RecJ n=1 Tax=Marinicrinis sediminis TaxID=1652465 RepID=A0ABW5R6S4_9BACL
MLRSKTRWRNNQIHTLQEAAQQLATELKLPLLVAQLLVQRGIQTKAEAELFLHGDIPQLHDPFLMEDMKAAVDRLERARVQDEFVRISGDYDADGVSSTSLMILLLTRLGIRHDYYIPNRFTEGYGIGVNAVEQAHADGVDLIVTVDNGIRAHDALHRAKELGLDVIVTDHHEPPEELPEACALLNPRKSSCPYPFKELAGAGVALKLAQAILGDLPNPWFEIAAIGTVADLMPLTDENRIMVRKGLQSMKNTTFPGIQALLKIGGVKVDELSATDIGFAMGPRINAAGRLEDAAPAVELLVADSMDKAEELAKQLDVLNRERQKLVEKISTEALEIIHAQQMEDHPVIVVSGEEWNHGVVGIVASKMLHRFYRPVIILSHDPQTGLTKGSARSIEGFDIHEALNACADLLMHYGGHQAAGGMTLEADRLDAFRERMHQLAESWLSEEDYTPVQEADLEVRLEDVTLTLIEQLQMLAPFGAGNRYPALIVKEAQVEEYRAIGKNENHLKLTLTDQSQDQGQLVKLDAIAFGQAEAIDHIGKHVRLDLLAEPQINEWNGIRKPQLVVQDLCMQAPLVVDWRQRHAHVQVAQRIEQLHREGKLEHAGMVVFSRNEEPKSFWMDTMKQMPLWKLGEQDQLEPVNELARSSRPEQVKEMVLYGVPNSQVQLEEMLERLEQAEKIYLALTMDNHWSCPNRSQFAHIYKCLRTMASWKLDQGMLLKVSKTTGLLQEAVYFAHQVFEELGFIAASEGLEDHYESVDSPVKKELSASRLYQMRVSKEGCMDWLQYETSKQLMSWVLSKLPARPSHPSSHIEQTMEEVS